MEQQQQHEQSDQQYQPQHDREQWEDEQMLTVDDILNFYAARH